jgi:undecaprenyl diphosphate synthase
MAIFSSSTKSIPDTFFVPRHVAVIMDGNGRWAKKRFLPRVAGHKRGVEAVREMVKSCASLGVEFLTLFAFSSENWRRPQEEVSFLMGLFMEALSKEVHKLHQNDIRMVVIGDRSQFDATLCAHIEAAETLTRDNKGLTLTIAANYGGRWDLMQALNKLAVRSAEKSGSYTEDDLTPYLSMHFAPEPDLFIRTGGEKRISNFLLWQLAYTELYFTDTLWPDFDQAAFNLAIQSFQARERRFGRTSEQLTQAAPNSELHKNA